MATFKLAKERLNTGSQMGGLNTNLLNASAGRGIAAPGININAGNVGYSNMTPNTVIPDTKLSAMAQASGIMLQSAMDYNKRQDEFIATTKILDLKEKLRVGFDGSTDDAGNLTGGYRNTTLAEAGMGYKGYSENVEKQVKDALEDMSPQQRYFAWKGVAGLRDSYLGMGATHASKELASAQKEVNGKTYNSVLLDFRQGEGNVDAMAHALSLYSGNPKEFKARNTEMTEAALNSAFLSGGAVGAMNMAKEMRRKGVGDPKSVLSFVKMIESDAYTAETRNHERLTRQRARGEDSISNVMATTGVTAIMGGNMKGFFSDVGSAAIDPAQFATATQGDSMRSLVAQTVENAGTTYGDKRVGLTRVRAAINAQWNDIPLASKDDITRELQDIQDRYDAEDITALNQEKTRRTEAQAQQKRDEWNLVQIYQKDFDSPDPEKKNNSRKVLGDLLLTSPNDNVKNQISQFFDGTTNPFEDKELYDARRNISDYVRNKRSVEDLNVSWTKKQAFQKEIDTIKKSNGEDYSKLGLKQLETYFQIESSALSGYSVSEGISKITKDEAKENYINAANYYSTVFSENLQKGMLPAEASNSAMTTILSADVYTKTMTNLPKGAKGEGKARDLDIEKFGYFGDTSSLSKKWQLPDTMDGLEGSADLATYAKSIGTGKTEGQMPEVAFRARVLEQGNLIKQRIAEATANDNQGDIVKWSAIASNFQLQAQALFKAVAESTNPYKKVGEVKKTVDGDTVDDTRFAGINTPEAGTPEGDKATAVLKNALKALGSNVETSAQKELGGYNRIIGDITSADGTVVNRALKHLYNYPAYEPPKAKGRK